MPGRLWRGAFVILMAVFAAMIVTAAAFSQLPSTKASSGLITNASLIMNPGLITGNIQTDSSLKLAENALLDESITFTITDSPLGTALEKLSGNLKVKLRASRLIADQRVTLHLRKQPLRHVMARLMGLLSHSPSHAHGYYWERVKTPEDHRPCYQLWRDARSVEEEKESLDYPRRQAARYLRELARTARLSPEQQASAKIALPRDYLTDEDFQPFRDALKNLSDAQIEALTQGEDVPIDTVAFRDQITTFNQRWRDSAKRQHENALTNGGADPYPTSIPETPPSPPSLGFRVDDYDAEHPERASLYGLYLQGVALLNSGEMHIVFDPLQDNRKPYSESGQSAGRIIDLTPQLQDADVTTEQRSDSGFTLQALAAAANINIYQEHFFRTVYWGARSSGLKTMKGTLPELINAICKEWGYQAEKAGDDYVFWSLIWAQDRANDIPDILLNKWKRLWKAQGHFTLENRVEMASLLNWPQIRSTLTLVLPQSGPWNLRRQAAALRFLGGLGAAERFQAMSAEGLALSSLSLEQQGGFLKGLFPAGENLPVEPISLARIYVFTETPGSDASKRTVLEVRSNKGNSLFRTELLEPPPQG